jgi:hypothetical protein
MLGLYSVASDSCPALVSADLGTYRLQNQLLLVQDCQDPAGIHEHADMVAKVLVLHLGAVANQISPMTALLLLLILSTPCAMAGWISRG